MLVCMYNMSQDLVIHPVMKCLKMLNYCKVSIQKPVKHIVADKAERVPGSSESEIYNPTGHEGRQPVKLYRNRKTTSHKQSSNNTGGGSFKSEVTYQLGALRDELNISLSASSSVDRNKFKLNRTLKDSSNNKESLDKPLINGTSRSSCACKEWNVKSENIDDLMTHEQTDHSEVKIYSCFDCLKMLTYSSV